jgi:hypothetical protein
LHNAAGEARVGKRFIFNGVKEGPGCFDLGPVERIAFGADRLKTFVETIEAQLPMALSGLSVISEQRI